VLKEFRDFINRGNVIDLAVAVILGAAFGLIIASVVNDLLMPLIGILIGGVGFQAMVLQVGTAQLKYGNLIQAIVNFLIVAFVLFLIVRQFNKMKKTAPPAPPVPSAEERLLTEIRDILRARQ
jgi:large conductance mechanosensitive channel